MGRKKKKGFNISCDFKTFYSYIDLLNIIFEEKCFPWNIIDSCIKSLVFTELKLLPRGSLVAVFETYCILILIKFQKILTWNVTFRNLRLIHLFKKVTYDVKFMTTIWTCKCWGCKATFNSLSPASRWLKMLVLTLNSP